MLPTIVQIGDLEKVFVIDIIKLSTS